MDLTDWKTTSEIIKNFAIVAGFACGGLWTYYLFVKNRICYPSAELSHEVNHIDIESDKVLLHVEVKIENLGKTLIRLKDQLMWVQQVSPLPENVKELMQAGEPLVQNNETEIPWQIADGGDIIQKKWVDGDASIEPGENQAIHFEFILIKPIDTVKIYSFISNAKKSAMGWDKTSLYNLKPANRGKHGTETSATEDTATTKTDA